MTPGRRPRTAPPRINPPAPGLAMALPAPGPQAWLDTHLRARFAAWEEDPSIGSAHVVTTADLLPDGAGLVRRSHERLVAAGTPAPAAAVYLAGWYAGAIAGAVGYALATAGAGFLLAVGRGQPEVRLHLHPEGWPVRVELPVRALVLPGHPWDGDVGTVVVRTRAQLLASTVHDLVRAVSPIVDACHATARVGTAGLWNEVADALGKAVAFQHRVVVTSGMVDVLDAAVAVDGVPWKARPRLGFARSEQLGDVHVAQKGGCCLAYTAPADGVPDPDDPELDPYHRAYLCRFPDDVDRPRYCSTCSFRDPADAEARQVLWHEHHAPTTVDGQETRG